VLIASHYGGKMVYGENFLPFKSRAIDRAIMPGYYILQRHSILVKKKSRFTGWQNGTHLRRLIGPPPGTAVKLLMCRRKLVTPFLWPKNRCPTLSTTESANSMPEWSVRETFRQSAILHDSGQELLNSILLFICYPDRAGATWQVTVLSERISHER